jgi:hypothetical protein
MTSQTKIPWFNSSFNLTNLPAINEKKRARVDKKSQIKSINEDEEEAFNLNNLDNDLNTLFTNKFEPKRKFDLIVNSRKITEVEQWFDYIFLHRPPESVSDIKLNVKQFTVYLHYFIIFFIILYYLFLPATIFICIRTIGIRKKFHYQTNC